MREEETKTKRVGGFMSGGAIVCVLLLTIFCTSAVAQNANRSVTVGEIVLQMALHSGYTGDSEDDAADFLAANAVLPPGAIGNLDRPATRKFLKDMRDAGIDPDLVILSAIGAGTNRKLRGQISDAIKNSEETGENPEPYDKIRDHFQGQRVSRPPVSPSE